MKDLEDSIHHQVDQIIEIKSGLEMILETALEIHKIEREEQQENPMVRKGLQTNLETIQVIYRMIEQEMVEMILNRNLRNIGNNVIKMVILRIIAGRCKPMQRKQKGLRTQMIKVMIHQTHLFLW